MAVALITGLFLLTPSSKGPLQQPFWRNQCHLLSFVPSGPFPVQMKTSGHLPHHPCSAAQLSVLASIISRTSPLTFGPLSGDQKWLDLQLNLLCFRFCYLRLSESGEGCRIGWGRINWSSLLNLGCKVCKLVTSKVDRSRHKDHSHDDGMYQCMDKLNTI